MEVTVDLMCAGVRRDISGTAQGTRQRLGVPHVFQSPGLLSEGPGPFARAPSHAQMKPDLFNWQRSFPATYGLLPHMSGYGVR